MKALTIRQPWAWLIAQGHKPVENRTWHTKHRGRILIHAAKGMTRQEYVNARDWADHCGVAVPAFADLERGGFVGTVELFDSVDTSDSPWYMGQKAMLLRDARPLPFLPYKGQLGFFEVDPQALGLVIGDE